MNATSLFIISCIVTFFVFYKIRSFKSRGKDNQIRYHFLTSSLEFLIPFSLVMLTYATLIYIVNNYWQSISLQSLIELESYIENIRSYTRWKLSKEMVLFLFIGIYSLGLLRIIPLKKRKKLYSGTDTIYRWTKRLYIIFVLLCSFSILGTQLGEPSNQLNLRIKTVREGYADIQNQVKSSLSNEIIPNIYTKSFNDITEKYQSALELPTKIHSEANNLNDQYLIAQNKYSIESNTAESQLNSFRIRQRTVSSIDTTIKIHSELRGSNKKISVSNPKEINYYKISKAKEAINRYAKKQRLNSIKLIKTEDGKRLTIQGAKVITNAMKSSLFSSWIKTYPILEPVFNVFIQTVDKTVTSKIEKLSISATDSIVKNPQKTQSILNAGSSKIVNNTKINISASSIDMLKQHEAKMLGQLSSIQKAKTEINTSITQAEELIKQNENKKIEKLISQLQSPDKSTRTNAARKISKKGQYISQKKVDRLLSIMRSGKKEWETYRHRPSGHHCTDYEYTSIRYYAATAIEDMQSKYVTESLKREARSARRNSVRSEQVTDPGWV